MEGEHRIIYVHDAGSRVQLPDGPFRRLMLPVSRQGPCLCRAVLSVFSQCWMWARVFGVHSQGRCLCRCLVVMISGVLHGRCEKNERVRKEKERIYLGDVERISQVEVGGGGRSWERRGCVSRCSSLCLCWLPVVFLSGQQAASSVDSYTVFLVLIQKQGSVLSGLPFFYC